MSGTGHLKINKTPFHPEIAHKAMSLKKIVLKFLAIAVEHGGCNN